MSVTYLYRHFDAGGTLLYVGVSLSTLVRLMQHRHVSPWWEEIATVSISSFASREDALVAERQAVEGEKPRYNKMLQLPKPKPKPLATKVDASRLELLHRVAFKPVYTIQQAADVLGTSTSTIKILIDHGKIGWMHHAVGGRKWISGWHLIEYLENQQSEGRKVA
jgi:excisionase family DNA binding protein